MKKPEEGWRRLKKPEEGRIKSLKLEEGWRHLDVFLHNSARIPATDLSSRLPGDTPSSFVLTWHGKNPRFLGGSYGVRNFQES